MESKGMLDERNASSDYPGQDSEFRSSILKVDASQFSLGAVDDLDTQDNELERLNRSRPFGQSTTSRTSRTSRVSLSPNMILGDQMVKRLFSSRANVVESAVEDCKASVIIQDVDGEIKGHWLLTEIDHWDMEKERLVMLTAKSLLVIKYDLIAQKPCSCKRIPLRSITHVEIGDFVYPHYSVMPPREHGGFRVHWTSAPMSTLQRWNPLCEDVGFITLTHHLLAYHDKDRDTITFNVSDLVDSVIEAVGVVRRTERIAEQLRVENRPITIESYASAASLVFNQGHVGFNMERGGVSF